MPEPKSDLRRWLFAIPAVFIVHLAEEAWQHPLLGRFGPMLARLPANENQLRFELAIAAAVSLALWAIGITASRGSWRAWLLFFVQAIYLVNAFMHFAETVTLKQYSAGVVTALGLELPFSVVVFRKALREQWLNRSGLALVLSAGFAVHVFALAVLHQLAIRLVA